MSLTKDRLLDTRRNLKRTIDNIDVYFDIETFAVPAVYSYALEHELPAEHDVVTLYVVARALGFEEQTQIPLVALPNDNNLKRIRAAIEIVDNSNAIDEAVDNWHSLIKEILKKISVFA